MLTHEKNRKIVERKKGQDETNRQLVFVAMKALAKPVTSTQIFNEINTRILRECKVAFQDLIEAGEIPSTNNRNYWNKLWKQRRITLRTVQRHLRRLSDDRFLVHNKKYYSLSSMDYPEARIWAKEFGNAALGLVMRTLYPNYNRLEYNLKMLVQIFGSYLVYCFIEAASPISNNNRDTIPGYRRDELALSWVESMIVPRRLFYYFAGFMKSQSDEEEVRKTRKKIFSIKNGKYFFHGDIEDLTCNLTEIMQRQVKYPLEHSDTKENYETRNSILEGKFSIIETIRKILQKEYAMLNTQMDAVHHHFDIKNKEGIKLKPTKRHFTPEESIHGIWDDILEKIPAWDDELVVKKD